MAIRFHGSHRLCIALLMMASVGTSLKGIITSNSRNDPDPIFTALDPHTFLYTYHTQSLKGITPIRDHQEHFSLSISPYAQNASKAKTLKKDPTVTSIAADSDPCLLPAPCKEICIEIGDIYGRWAMLPLLFGPVPQGATLPPALVQARSILYPDIPPGTVIDDPASVSTDQTCGFFSVPVCYYKRGVRFEAEGLLGCDFGIKAALGVANILQVPSEFRNLTTTCTSVTNPNITVANVNQALMDPCKFREITDQILFDIATFEETSVEDVRAELYWRHAYLVNHNEKTWAEFLLIPFFEVGGSLAVGKERDPNKAFALSFGSNDHHSVGFTAGLNIDFTETIVIGAEGGVTHFFSRDFCNYRVPTHVCQSGIYPFMTDVNIQPGNNNFFGVKMAAYHFLDRLSFWGEWFFVKHLHDRICLKTADTAFLPDVLERISVWQNQVFNVALNYDISPNINLGIFWQAPFKQINTYRSTTLMFTFNVTF